MRARARALFSPSRDPYKRTMLGGAAGIASAGDGKGTGALISILECPGTWLSEPPLLFSCLRRLPNRHIFHKHLVRHFMLRALANLMPSNCRRANPADS